MQNDPNIENEELVNDEVAQQLANLQATDPSDPQPGQQIQPDPNAPDPVANNDAMDQYTQPYTPPAASADPVTGQTPDPGPTTVPTPDPQPAVPDPAPVDEPAPAVAPAVPEPAPVEEPAPAVAPAVPEPAVEEEAVEEEAPAEEAAEEPEVPTVAEPADEAEESENDVVSESDDLESIKKKALEELTPLVDKLDLTPEKRYDVIIEMIQASDDRNLVEKAYEAAHAIQDDDLRAQALMEIVNEIDYLNKGKKEE